MNDSKIINTLIYQIAANPNKWISLSKSDTQETNDAVNRCLDLGLIKETSNRTYRLSEAGNYIIDNQIDYDQYFVSKMSDNEIIKKGLNELYEGKYYTLNIEGKKIERIEKRLFAKELITMHAGSLMIPSLTALGDEFVESGLDFDVWIEKKETKQPAILNSGIINHGTITHSTIDNLQSGATKTINTPAEQGSRFGKILGWIINNIWLTIFTIATTVIAAIILKKYCGI